MPSLNGTATDPLLGGPLASLGDIPLPQDILASKDPRERVRDRKGRALSVADVFRASPDDMELDSDQEGRGPGPVSGHVSLREKRKDLQYDSPLGR